MHLLYFLILFYGKTALSAQQLTIDYLEIPPMTSATDPKHGIIGEIVQAAVKRAGYDFVIYNLPTARAVATVAGMKDTLIAPLARIKVREENFVWIAPLVEVNRAFYSLGKKVHSFKEAKLKYKAIAISRGSASIPILLDNGFSKSQLVEVSGGESAPQMLLVGHVDAWYNPISEANIILKSIKDSKRISRSQNLGSSINYLGCSKICDAKIVKKLRSTLKRMSEDGTLSKMTRSYGVIEGLKINFEFNNN